MDKPVLVEKDFADGVKLIQNLEKNGLEIHSALWYYLTESEQWTLIIATPMVENNGLRETYKLIQAVINQNKEDYDFSLENISLRTPKDKLIQTLGRAIKTGKEISGIRFTGNTINNVYIKDAYIYRIQ